MSLLEINNVERLACTLNPLGKVYFAALFVVKAGDMNGLRRIRNITRKSAFNAYLNGLRPTAMAIEDLSPEGPSHPNPEYPWEVKGRIITPIAHDFPNLKLSNIAMKKMLDFLESCFKLIERES